MRIILTVVALAATLLPATARADAAVAMAGRDSSRATSANWAGYVVEATHRFTAVTGTWTVPAISCAGVREPTAAAIWVGLDGFRDKTVEQIGVKATCASSARYTGWWQMWPAPVHRLAHAGYPVRPGDVLTATVTRNGKLYTLALDSSAGWRFAVLQQGSAEDSSAEWIASSPPLCETCRYVALADFGTATFANAQAAAGGGLRGVLSFAQPDGSAEAVTMAAADGVVRARPSPVSSAGNCFSVAWRHA
jgi:hypothetical protein